MKRGILTCFLLLMGCGQNSERTSHPLMDSVTSREVVVSISSSNVLALTSYLPQIKTNIGKQLRYLVGPLAQMGGTPDLSELNIDVRNLAKDGEFHKVNYSATFKAILPKTFSVPVNLTLPIPSRGDEAGTNDFYQRYYRNARYQYNCTASTTNLIMAANFWYYFRPQRPTCPLKEKLEDMANIQWINVMFKAGEKNSTGKYPEYHELWKGDRLKALILVGKENPKNRTTYDVGTSAYLNLYKYMVQWLGPPNYSSLGNEEPDASTSHIKAEFQYLNKAIDLDLFLIANMRTYRTEYASTFKELSANADFIAYNGHSGLGVEIEQLMKMSEVKPGKYQLYFINACSSFAYRNRILEKRFRDANTGSPASKYLDMIMNTMPGYFRNIPTDNIHLLSSLVSAKENYFDILAKMSRNQNLIVIGEQDNLWPAPF